MGLALVFKFILPIRELQSDDPYFRLHRVTVAQASLCIVATIFLYVLSAWGKLALSSPLVISLWKHLSLIAALTFILVWYRRIRQSLGLIFGPTEAWSNLAFVGLKAALVVLMMHDLYWLLVPEDWLRGQALYHTTDDLRRYIAEHGPFWSGVVILVTTVTRQGLTALIEELCYRGLFYSALRKHLSVAPALCWSSVSFMLGHEWFSLSIFLSGCIYAFLYETYHSILPAIIVHFSWNAHIHFFGWAMSASLLSPKTWYVSSLMFTLFVLVALSFLQKRNGISSPVTRKTNDPCDT